MVVKMNNITELNVSMISDLNVVDLLNETCAMADIAVHGIVQVDDASPIASALLLVVSIVLGLWGAHILRLSMALVGAGVGFWFGYELLARRAETSCSARLQVGVAAAIAFGALAACAIDAALFLLGAIGAATVAHFVYAPELDTMLLRGTEVPRLAGRSALYFGLVACSGLAGGIYVRCRGKSVLRIVTSVVGGVGSAYAVLLLLEPHTDAATARGVSGVVGFAVGVVGAALQTGRCRRMRKKSVEKEAKQSTCRKIWKRGKIPANISGSEDTN
jgi:hypothetical protein